MQWRFRVRAWLVRHDAGLLLFDSGLGGATSPTQSWAPTTGALARELDAIGIGRHHIDTVVISHAHDDHIGGVLDDAGAPMFPNARYVIQQADHDWLHDLAPTDEEAAACLALLRPLADAGILELIERRSPHRHRARAAPSAGSHTRTPGPADRDGGRSDWSCPPTRGTTRCSSHIPTGRAGRTTTTLSRPPRRRSLLAELLASPRHDHRPDPLRRGLRRGASGP